MAADPPTVLIADDAAQYRNPLASYLRSRGFRVLCAADGQEALGILRENKIDLLVSDLLMPRLGGDALVAYVRSDERLRDTPIIIISATHGVPPELRAEVQAWLVKSQVSLAETLECVGLHLARAAAGAPRSFPPALGGVPAPAPQPGAPAAPAHSLVRLDLGLIRRNLELSTGVPQGDDEVMRLLAGMGAWRHNEEWWGAGEAALATFREGEILERRDP